MAHAAFAAAVLLSGCSAMTTMTSAQPETTMTVRGKALGKMPVKVDLRNTSFGNYEFRALRADGKAMYGILPLKFNGGQLAVNILLFAPASFFNLREVYAQYEFDVDKEVVRYRSTDEEAWAEMKPTAAEAERARKFFGAS
jgi:hypothetical protein